VLAGARHELVCPGRTHPTLRGSGELQGDEGEGIYRALGLLGPLVVQCADRLDGGLAPAGIALMAGEASGLLDAWASSPSTDGWATSCK